MVLSMVSFCFVSAMHVLTCWSYHMTLLVELLFYCMF